MRFFVQDGIQQGRVDLKIAVVIDVTQLPKPIHKVTHAGASRADHVRECLLADFSDHRLLFSLLAEIRQQQSPRQPLLAGIEQLVDQVFLDADVRAKRCVVNRSENFGSSPSIRTMVALPNRVITESSTALAVETRRGRPVRQPSPINYLGQRQPRF